jgi:hypothetical protein
LRRLDQKLKVQSLKYKVVELADQIGAIARWQHGRRGLSGARRSVTAYTHEMSWLRTFSGQKAGFCGPESAQGEAPELLAGRLFEYEE